MLDTGRLACDDDSLHLGDVAARLETSRYRHRRRRATPGSAAAAFVSGLDDSAAASRRGTRGRDRRARYGSHCSAHDETSAL
jgi:hypothetical protein